MTVFAVMLGYNKPEVIKGGMQNFADTVDPNYPIKKVFIELGYPITSLPREVNRQACEEFGWEYNEFKNEGVMGNWNKVIHEILVPIHGMKDGDFLHTFDPDVRMNCKGWLPSMVAALAEPKRMFCSSSMNFHSHDWMYKPPYNRKVKWEKDGVSVATWDCLIAWASGMWKADFLITRPRDFGCAGKFYGWNEHADYDRLIKHGFTWCSVADFIDYHLGAPDQDYTIWKQESAAHKTAVAFDEWLRQKGKL